MNYIERFLNIIYPPVCGFCDEINENFLCNKCKRKFEEIKISDIDDYCDAPVYFDEHCYLLKYENEVREFILKYKFEEKSHLYKSLAKIITYDVVFRQKFINKYDCIICVPIHRKRFKSRGYNQSQLIAKEVGKVCGVEIYDDVLIKEKNIVAQSTLDKLGRIANIKGAFSKGINANAIKGKKVAMFDDIFTTGATCNECAKVLKEAGASKVGIFTLAKD